MVTLPSPRPRLGPGLDNQIVSLFKALAVEGRVGVTGERLHAAAANDSGYQTAFGEQVNHGQLFGQPHRVVSYRQGISECDDFDPVGGRRDRGRKDVALGLHAERRIVMLVEHDAVPIAVFDVLIFREPLIVAACQRSDRMNCWGIAAPHNRTCRPPPAGRSTSVAR